LFVHSYYFNDFRFDIPEPPPNPEQQAALDRGEIITRDDLKRFRHEYSEPIQLR